MHRRSIRSSSADRSSAILIQTRPVSLCRIRKVTGPGSTSIIAGLSPRRTLRNTTWTLSRDSAQGLDFEATNYYDGEDFMVRKKINIKSVAELNGASVCVGQGTTTELNLADYFRANKMKYEVVAF